MVALANKTNIELSAHSSDEVSATYRKVTWRLVAFLFICYVMAYLDRVNVGYAQLQMKEDLGFSDAVYGLGAGIFFAGYFLFEVPSNLILTKIGVRRTIMRIMIAWGLISTSMMFVTSPAMFYTLRFLLGVFEAGFLPGVIYYLTMWYPSSRRARIIAIFMSAIPISGIIGGPLSGWIMQNWDGYMELGGWQWMFLLEGLPTVLIGFLVPFVLVDRPSDATWLTQREKQIIHDLMNEEHASKDSKQPHTFREALRDPRIYLLAFVYFSSACGLYGISFWLPTILKDAGATNVFSIGLYSIIPYGFGVLGMLVVGSHSDRRMERRWHLALCLFACAASFIALTFSGGNLVFALIALTFGAASIFATMPVFWAIPTVYLSGSSAAGGIAMINSLAILGGFLSPSIMGWAKDATGSLNNGIYLIGAVLLAGGIAILIGMPKQLLAQASTDRHAVGQ